MSINEKLMLNDRQIFDLQFLHKQRQGRPKRKWEQLLRSEVFDPTSAARFVTTVGAPEKKVDALGLRGDEQLLLAAIRVERVRKWWERTRKQESALRHELATAIKMGRSKLDESNIDRWCEEFVALKAAEGRPALAARRLQEFFSREKPANQLANRKHDLAAKGFRVDVE